MLLVVSLVPSAWALRAEPQAHSRRRPHRSTTCCCAAVTSSTRGTRSAPCATSRLPAARSRRSPSKLNPADALKTVDVVGLVRDARPDRHPRARLHRHRRAALLCRRQQRLSGRLHVPRRRDDRRRCRLRRLAELRRLQAARHRSIEDAHPRVPQHRRQRHARREVRAGSRRHGGEADRRHGAASIPG